MICPGVQGNLYHQHVTATFVALDVAMGTVLRQCTWGETWRDPFRASTCKCTGTLARLGGALVRPDHAMRRSLTNPKA